MKNAATVLDLIQTSEAGRVAIEKWDNWDYSVYAPSSLDETACFLVFLKNKDGSVLKVEVRFPSVYVLIERVSLSNSVSSFPVVQKYPVREGEFR